MKSIKSLSLIITLFVGTMSFAQSHNTIIGSACKFAKNRCTNMEGCPVCSACDKDDIKEKEVKQAEITRRNEQMWAEAKAKKEAEQKTYQDKLAADNAEAKKNAESGNVLINAPKVTINENLTKQNNTVKKTTIISSNNNLLISDQKGGFKNINDEVVIPQGTFESTKGASFFENVNWYDFPKDVGIISLKNSINQTDNKAFFRSIHLASDYTVKDLINGKGERFFNSDTVSFIGHLYGDWFLIGTNFYSPYGLTNSILLGSAKLYNIKSNVEQPLPFSAFNNAAVIKQVNYERYAQVILHNVLYKNPSYSTGSYIASITKQPLHEKLLDNLSGGNDKWKAYLFITINLSQQQTEYKIFYINSNDEIEAVALSKEDKYKYLQKE